MTESAAHPSSGSVEPTNPGLVVAGTPSSSQLFFGIMSEQAARLNDTKQHTDHSQPRIQLPPLPPPPAPVQLPPTSQLHFPSSIVGDLIGLHSDVFSRAPHNTSPLPASNTELVMNGVGDASLSQQQQLHQQQRVPEVGRALNVTDALSYLDAVKSQFSDKPEVYNQFLDIMKDFKSQSIDTPGVIQRVSKLFHGNPALIQGFNTFLPVGYRIDISSDPSDNTITVTTPNGTVTHTTSSNTIIGRPSRELPSLSGPGLGNSFGYPPGHPSHTAGPGQPSNGGPGSRSMTPHGYPPNVGPGHSLPQLPPGASPYLDGAVYSPGLQHHAAAATFLGNLNNKNPSVSNTSAAQEAKPTTEFNHAIHYLNKIKSRYTDDPNTYKQFLDILQTYQKEQRHTHDTQVYVQVQMLFKDAPDLIAEFKAFLPDVVGGSGGGLLDQGGMMMGHPGSLPMDPWGQREREVDLRHPSPPPNARKQSTASKRKKRPLEKEPTPVPIPPTKATTSRHAKKVKHHHNPDTGSPSFSPYPAPRSPPPQQVYHSGVATIVQHGVPYPQSHNGNTSADKLLFFDRAKKSLETREVYEEFLKLLSLFSKDIIDAKTLIERAKVFLGDENLMTEFKDLIGWDDRMEDVTESGPPGSIRTAAPEVPQPVDDGEGPSYRRLLDSEIRLACSGRDELCRSLLNDEWVSHPTWASEESGFVAHKKNSFEEALHKSEEERHEYHVHIEALTRTIAVLEPLCARIEEMPPEERSAFKLKPDFGGTAKAIYHRTIKRVYGRDNGLEIIQALQDAPSIAVPVVLARLKQRDEEWKRAQREWSRTWREVDSKNFYKSLDHQGISFKQNDKKNITAKYFCTDIDTIKKQQTETDSYDPTNVPKLSWQSTIHGSIDHQLEYTFNDASVLLDSLKLIYSFLDRSQVQYSALERRSVDKFLRAFIPCLFSYPDLELGNGPSEGGGHLAIQLNGGAVGEEVAAVHEIMMLNGGSQTLDGPRSGRRSSGGTPHSTQSNGVPASDLRKKLLKTAQEKASASRKEGNATAATGGTNTKGDTSAMGSRGATPSPESRFAQTDDNGRVIPDIWIREVDPSSEPSMSEQSDLERPFFANTTFYTLLRLLQLLYSRLLMCKEIGAELAAQKYTPLLANEIAVELGLVDPHGPPVVLQQTIEAMGGRGTVEGANAIYAYLLNACERLFDNEMDQPTFEEHMRWFFGTRAYHLFTVDKLLTALIKQVQSILSDHKSQELWTLLQTAQSSERLTKQEIVRYRRNAEEHIGTSHDDHLFRIQWIRQKKSIRMTLLSQEDATIPTDGRALSRWREYLNTYVMSYPTEWLPSPKSNPGPIFLRRTLQAEESTASTLAREEQTKIRVVLPSYKLVYEKGCEDIFWRDWNAEEGGMLRERARARNEDRKRSRVLCP